MKRKTREEKAITLIALIITIVVLLILAVVAINAVTGDGIIQHATNARSEYEKAQDAEKDMLSYYEGVLQSGEVVPTVEQLQEKYEFSYYSKLSLAITDVNNSTTANADPNLNAENAVAGIYEDGGNKYVVLMKDTESNESIFVTADMTINLGGKTLKFTTPEAKFCFGKESASATQTTENNVIIDGRIGGSSIEKEIQDASTYNNTDDIVEIILAYGKSLKINSGKYSVKGVNANKVFVMRIYAQNQKFEMDNAKIIASNNATSSTYCRGILVKSEEAIINNCSFDINTNIGHAYGIYNTSINLRVSNTNVNINSDNGKVYGVTNSALGGITSISNTNVYLDVSNNTLDKASGGVLNFGGTIRIYSSYLEGVLSAFYAQEETENYIYNSTLYGKGSYGIYLAPTTDGDVKIYAEDTKIISGEYKGKHNFADFTGTKGNAIYASKTIEMYMDNCNIVGNNQINSNSKAIETVATEPANINISNCRITGTLDIIENKTLNLGYGMNKADLTITGAGIVNETGINYKGYDKILMEQN